MTRADIGLITVGIDCLLFLAHRLTAACYGSAFLGEHMRRRDFIKLVGGAATFAPLAARSQPAMIPVIGVLDSSEAVAGFRKGLNEAGYVEGHNVTIELRATDQNDRLPTLAAELVSRQVAVIAALGGFASHAAKAATATIPIVFSVGGDPVELGLVGSLNRPGGNVTGVTFFAAQLLQKQVGLLHELVPKASVLGFLVNPDNPRAPADVSRVREAARSLGLETHVVDVRAERDLEAAFASLLRQRADALLIGGDALFSRTSAAIAGLATRHAIPAICGTREIAEAGVLMAYTANLPDAYRQNGIYVGRILKGEKPGDLPVVQPAKFDSNQPQDRQGARPHSAYDHANDRQRGNRIVKPIAAVHMAAGTQRRFSNVRFSAASGAKQTSVHSLL
jgi:putative ABC transport system substrate-binding protein